MKLHSPAKLNLILKIVGKTSNNYHLLEMLNTKIDLQDEIEILESNETHISYDKYNIDKDKDTIYKTITSFINEYNIPHQSIYIKKNIPVGAGLGGVSSDIATIIKYLNEQYQLKLTQHELIDFVLPFGTDICYLLHDQKAIVSGVGEIIEPLEYKINKHVLLINPNILVETKYIYSNVEKISQNKINKTYIYNNDITQILENDLENVVFKCFPKIKKIYDELKKYLDNIHMSGSGSTLYSLIDEKDIKLVDILKDKYPNFFIGIYNII